MRFHCVPAPSRLCVSIPFHFEVLVASLRAHAIDLPTRGYEIGKLFFSGDEGNLYPLPVSLGGGTFILTVVQAFQSHSANPLIYPKPCPFV